jgi:DNA-binding NtrC family response regulator
MALRRLLTITLGKASECEVPGELIASWDVRQVDQLGDAQKLLSSQPCPVALLLLGSLEDDEVNALDRWLHTQATTQWVAVLPVDAIKRLLCRDLIVQHFFDFHTWPIDAERLNHTLGHAFGYAELRNQPDRSPAARHDMALVGQSAAIQQLRHQIRKVAQVGAPVLIAGESGSGKELTARAVHNHSSRSKGPFIAVNCGAIPASLIQSELFGYERGAFTGAAREKKGLIESAAGGTLFLDEIGDLPIELQANLLRFLQEGLINRVGSSQSISVDVRVIAASHMDLEQAVKSGHFREDLLYRLNVLPLMVPPLRERKNDLELLSNHFFEVFSHDKSPRLTGFNNRALNAIRAYDWPGNVRELINRIRRAMVMSEGRMITPDDLGLPEQALARTGEALEDARIRAERDAISDCLLGSGNNISRAARDLGVSRMTLYRLMEKHGVNA